jgi:hypothetical protein
MPYKIVRIRYRWFVVDSASGKRFSKTGFTTAAEAQRQQVAIALSESARSGKPASYYFE